MNTLKYISLTIIIVPLIYGCTKCTQYNLKDDSVVPIVFPYSDNQQVVFLKNKIDTIVFRGQGIQNSYYDECSDGFRKQKKSIIMKYSNSELFGIDIIAGRGNDEAGIDVTLNQEYFFNSTFFSTFQHGNMDSYIVNGIKYDTIGFYPVTIYKEQTIYDTIVFKPRLGFIKIVMDGSLYELIK